MIAIRSLCLLTFFFGLCEAQTSVATRQGLKDLYDATNGKDWIWSNQNSRDGGIDWNFTGDYDPCQRWSGVRCDKDFDPWHVWYINVPYFGLEGTIPSTFMGGMKDLDRLHLNHNSLTGPIPDSVGNMTRILYLFLQNNYLTGTIPTIITTLNQMVFLSIEVNLLTGTIPVELGSIAIATMEFQRNSLTGTIPDNMWSITGVNHISFGLNSLTGTLPGNFQSRIAFFSISDNDLTGTIPEEISDLVNCVEVYLQGNLLTGTIPTFTIGPFLRTLGFSNNKFTGPLPTNIGGMVSLLQGYFGSNFLTGSLTENFNRLTLLEVLDVSTNLMHGSLPTLTTMTSLKSLLVSDNRFTGSLDGRLRLPNSPNCLYEILDFSSNLFTGSIPPEILKCPTLHTVAAVKNCITTAIPEDICAATQLQVLILDGLGASESCDYSTGSVISSSKGGITGSIPTCLFSMPKLTTLHMNGNNIRGSLEGANNISRSLIDFRAAHNAIKGPLPNAMQNHNWTELDLSHNKISGSLDKDALLPPSVNLKLSVNRLSGEIPERMQDLDEVNILVGNMYSCEEDHSDLPENDPYVEVYSCGSEEFEYTGYAWIGSFFIFSVGFIAIIARKHDSVWKGIVNAVQNGTLDPNGTTNESLLMLVVQALRKELLWILGYILILGVIYVIMNTMYSDYTKLYAWVFSAAFFSGVEPATVIMIAWIALTVMAYNVMKMRLQAKNEESNKSMKELSESTSARNTMRMASLSTADDNSYSPWKYYVYLTMAMTLNIAIVIGANAAYVAARLEGNKSEVIIAEIGLSIFKVFWNNVMVDMVLDVGYKRYLHVQNTKSSHHLTQLDVVFRNIITIGNMIVVPCFTVGFLSPQCFLNVIVPPAEATSSYSYEEQVGFSQLDTTIYTKTITYRPPFIYSYKCGAQLLKTFVPVFMFSSILVGFIIPASALLVPRLYQYSKGTYFENIMKKIDGQPDDDADVHYLAKNIKIWFDVEKASGKIVSLIAVLLTFGTAYPPLALAVFVAIASMTYRLQMTYDRLLRRVQPEQQKNFNVTLGAQSPYMIIYIRRSVWFLIGVSCVFYSLFVFDMYGDQLNFRGAFWAPVLLWCVPGFIWLYDYIQRREEYSERRRDRNQSFGGLNSARETEMSVVNGTFGRGTCRKQSLDDTTNGDDKDVQTENPESQSERPDSSKVPDVNNVCRESEDIANPIRESAEKV